MCHLLTSSVHKCNLIFANWRGLKSPQTIGRHARSSSSGFGTTCKNTWPASDHLKRALRQQGCVLDMTHAHVSLIPLSSYLCPVTFRPSDQHWSFSGIFARIWNRTSRQSTSLFGFHMPPAWSLDLMPGPTEAEQAQRQLLGKRLRVDAGASGSAPSLPHGVAAAVITAARTPKPKQKNTPAGPGQGQAATPTITTSSPWSSPWM